MLEYEVEIEGIYEVNRPSVAEKMHLKELNRKYIKKFGFPFISFGKENFFDVFTDIEKRIDNNKEEEILTAIKEIKKICRLRVLEIVQ